MEISRHLISVEKTARYSTFGNLSNQTKFIWMVLHGSNMICEQMLYKFKDFDPNTHFVIAPEGLLRFYANGFSGDVVASWMTKRDRLEEISDFSEYLSRLYDLIILKYKSQVKTILLGFSQGGTTAFRWLHSKKVDFDLFIPYACWIPEDINLKKSKTDFNKTTMAYSYGTEDQYLTPDRIKAIQEIVRKNELDLQFEAYSGKHKIERKQLKYLFEKYTQ